MNKNTQLVRESGERTVSSQFYIIIIITTIITIIIIIGIYHTNE